MVRSPSQIDAAAEEQDQTDVPDLQVEGLHQDQHTEGVQNLLARPLEEGQHVVEPVAALEEHTWGLGLRRSHRGGDAEEEACGNDHQARPDKVVG